MLNQPVNIQDSLKRETYYQDGNLFWRENKFKRRKDKKLGCVRKDGYTTTRFNYTCYLVHRLIWIYHNGDIPRNMQIDHIDGIKSNNKIENLRVVTAKENRANRALIPKSKNRYFGIKENKGRFYVSITKDQNIKHLGTFPSFEEALKERKKKEVEMGFHKNHGRLK